ncbi:hypothetical protein [Anaeromyxobacter oryzisoli]|uniref:hypothetical protein n=1 Tax=Anaeromyxobacter oryzisoli TaxID=2925408 RepID=UPI001F58F7E0|nr:hypothetical protein [Anaeromyxobacter sp. SG63]
MDGAAPSGSSIFHCVLAGLAGPTAFPLLHVGVGIAILTGALEAPPPSTWS